MDVGDWEDGVHFMDLETGRRAAWAGGEMVVMISGKMSSRQETLELRGQVWTKDTFRRQVDVLNLIKAFVLS